MSLYTCSILQEHNWNNNEIDSTWRWKFRLKIITVERDGSEICPSPFSPPSPTASSQYGRGLTVFKKKNLPKIWLRGFSRTWHLKFSVLLLRATIRKKSEKSVTRQSPYLQCNRVPFPVVWSDEGPVFEDEVLPLRRVQSNTSERDWLHP